MKLRNNRRTEALGSLNSRRTDRVLRCFSAGGDELGWGVVDDLVIVPEYEEVRRREIAVEFESDGDCDCDYDYEGGEMGGWRR